MMFNKLEFINNTLSRRLAYLLILVFSFLQIASVNVALTTSAYAATAPKTGAACQPSGGNFLGFAPWWAYLKNNFRWDPNPTGGYSCDFHENFNETCNNPGSFPNNQTYHQACQNVKSDKVVGVSTKGLDVVWLVALAIFEDLLRAAGLIAVFMVIYGGIRYVTSQGEPESTKAALGAILNALIGLVIAAAAAITVSFIGRSLGG